MKKAKKSGTMKMKWLPCEDQLLTEIVLRHGPYHWDLIALHLRGRNGKQCRERWITSLAPDVKKGQWTYEEDLILLKLQSQFGNQWAMMTKQLPGRSPISIKNRFKSLERHRSLINSSKPITPSCTNSEPCISPTQSQATVPCFEPFPCLDFEQQQNSQSSSFLAFPMKNRISLFN